MTDFHRIERSEGVFPVSELDWDNTYYAAMLDGKPYAYLHTQTAPGQDFTMLHITLLAFSRRILRECRADYRVLNKILKAAGIRRMIHLKEHPVRQWEKLMHLLGFSKPRDVRIEGKPYKTICMEVF